MNKGQELVEAPKAEIQPFDEYEAEIVQFEQYFSGKEYDLTNEEGIKVCEGDMLLLRKVEIRIDKTRKSRGKSLRDAVTELNASAKVCHNRVHAMWEVLDKPLAVIRQAELDAAIDKLEKEKAEEKAAEEKREADLLEREAKAKAKEAELKAKEDEINAEANQAEQAKRVKEAAEAAAAEATHAANNLRIAEDLEKQNEIDRAAEVDRQRQANVAHRKAFNNKAVEALDTIICNSQMSIDIVKAIVKGEIPNISMNY